MKRTIIAAALALAALPALAETAWDSRQEIALAPVERDFLLDEMQSNMLALQKIYAALATKDFKTAREAATGRGMSTFGDRDPTRPKTLTSKLPAAWKALSGPGRKGFDELAATLSDDADISAVLASLSKLHANCNACHLTFRLTMEK